MLTCSMMRFLSLLRLGLCARLVFVVLGLSVKLSWYPMLWVGAVVAVTVMHVLLFCVACVYAVRLLGCERDGNSDVGSGGGVVAMSAYMSGRSGSGVLSSAGEVIEMSVVIGVGEVCDMCMCLALGGVRGVGG